MSAGTKLRAPQEDRAILEAPPLAKVRPLLVGNQAHLSSAPINFLGKGLAELRLQARREIVTAASDFLRQAGEPIPQGGDLHLILAGHQPELFHPGVWIKNFALNGLARRHGLLPVNLVVDNDTAKSASVRLPVRETTSNGGVYLTSVPFDHMTAEVPYEERHVQDEEMFAGFDVMADAMMEPWGFKSILPDFWAEVKRQSQLTPLLGERFAAARRTFERRWGCHNFELPISRLCTTESFAWFVCHLLADSARFAEVHNAALLDHRKSHRIRSKNHPVPELERHGDYYETPFWAWRAGQLRRNRLFVRVLDGGIDLRAGDEEWPTVPLADPAETVAAWRLLEKQGFKVRTRALTTTLFARLIAGDLFIHGIGGGKYDELTDEIIRRYFAIEPPAFVVLSGTLLLPLLVFQNAEERMKRTHKLLRDFRYNPEDVWSELQSSDSFGLMEEQFDSPAWALCREKRAWLRKEPANKAERREQFQALRAINDRFQPFLAFEEGEERQKLARAEQEVHANSIMQRRDYSFCLFPEAKLREFCTQFLDQRT